MSAAGSFVFQMGAKWSRDVCAHVCAASAHLSEAPVEPHGTRRLWDTPNRAAWVAVIGFGRPCQNSLSDPGVSMQPRMLLAASC